MSSWPGAADEGQALAVLLGARGLADEHQVGVGVAGAEDDLGAGLARAGSGVHPRPRGRASTRRSRRSSARRAHALFALGPLRLSPASRSHLRRLALDAAAIRPSVRVAPRGCATARRRDGREPRAGVRAPRSAGRRACSVPALDELLEALPQRLALELVDRHRPMVAPKATAALGPARLHTSSARPCTSDRHGRYVDSAATRMGADRPDRPQQQRPPAAVWYLRCENWNGISPRDTRLRAHARRSVVGPAASGHSLARPRRGAPGSTSSLAGPRRRAAACGSAPRSPCSASPTPRSPRPPATRSPPPCPPLRFVGHTSGATGPRPPSRPPPRAGAEAFSLHPLQTIPDGRPTSAARRARSPARRRGARRFARTLADCPRMRPFEVAEESRAAYHAAASIASNFLVALEESAAELLERGRRRGPPRAARSARAAHRRQLGRARREALTGPIARGDEATVERHLDALARVDPRAARPLPSRSPSAPAAASRADRRSAA